MCVFLVGRAGGIPDYHHGLQDKEACACLGRGGLISVDDRAFRRFLQQNKAYKRRDP